VSAAITRYVCVCLVQAFVDRFGAATASPLAELVGGRRGV